MVVGAQHRRDHHERDAGRLDDGRDLLEDDSTDDGGRGGKQAEEQREAGAHNQICGSQIDGSVPQDATARNTVVAYEPVWAIGTGKTPTAADITAMHAHIRACLVSRLGDGARDMRILYGGSVNPSNAAEILNLPEVGGALVGGASLKAADFLAIIAAVKQP